MLPKRPLARLRADTSGIILPYVTIALVVIFGLSALAIDGAQLVSMQTQMQQAADAFALAGAAELNGLSSAESRANQAISNLISNNDLYGSAVSGATVTTAFYSALGGSDDGGITAGATAATGDADAAYILVTVAPKSLSALTMISSKVFGGSGTVPSVGAQAVAGLNVTACGVTPLFVCNPFETTNMSYTQATAAMVNAVKSTPSALIRLEPSAGSQYSPGNFGYLRPTTGALPAASCGSGQATAQAVAQKNPGNACYSLRPGVNFQTGTDPNVFDALNVRFDVFGGSFNSCRNDTSGLYPPDQNVRKGYFTSTGNNPCTAGEDQSAPSATAPQPSNCWSSFGISTCSYAGGANAEGLPIDQTMNGNVGNGVWNCAAYWSIAHPNGTTGASSPPTGCTSSATITRYSVYQYEISKNYTGDKSPGGEVGSGNYCSKTSADTSGTRRLLNVAVINCHSVQQSPFNVSLNGSATNVPVAGVAQMFLTVPVVNPNGSSGSNQPTDANAENPSGEVVQFIPSGQDKPGVLTTNVQLYR